MLKTVIKQTIILYALWLVLSGMFTPLLLVTGFVCCLGVAWLSALFNIAGTGGRSMRFCLRMVLYYLPWLSVEIVKSNLAVTRLIWRPRLALSPRVVHVRADQRTDIGIVVHANSITLTPGTISIDTSEGDITAHALTDEIAEDLLRGEMNRRVVEVERGF